MQDGQQPNEPGWVFKPGDATQDSSSLPQPVPVAPAADEPQVVSDQPTTAQEPVYGAEPENAPAEEAMPQVAGDNETDYPAHIEWTASEYIANPKGKGWFTLLAVGSLVLAAIIFVLSRDILSTVVIAVLGIIVAIFAARQPQTLQYRIDRDGLHVGQKFYPYVGFKAFSVAHEHAIGFIQLLPLKRFMPPLVIHYAPEDEDNIAEVLASYLPYEEHRADIVDSLTRKLRF